MWTHQASTLWSSASLPSSVRITASSSRTWTSSGPSGRRGHGHAAMACDRFQPVRPEQGHQRQAGVRSQFYHVWYEASRPGACSRARRRTAQDVLEKLKHQLPARLGVMPSRQLLEHDRTDRAAANPVIGTSPIHTTLQPHDPKLSLRLFALLLCCDILASVGIRSKLRFYRLSLLTQPPVQQLLPLDSVLLRVATVQLSLRSTS
jgi:hypothetical protein